MGTQQEPDRERSTAATAALDSVAGRRLVAELRTVKQLSGLSYARLEAVTPYSRASLERYINGKLFPSRHAVIAIAQACGADSQALSELWDEALHAGIAPLETATGEVATPALVEPLQPQEARLASTTAAEEPPSRPRRRRRLTIMIAVLTTVALLGLSLLVRSVIAPRPAAQPAPPTEGCRDYYADVHAYTIGQLCWVNATTRLTGVLVNGDAPNRATAQLCLSHVPDVCSQVLELATADPGQTVHLDRTVNLPPGHGAWVRACVRDFCSSWK